MSELFELTANEAAEHIRTGKLSAVELTAACLERIGARDETLHAWQIVDAEGAMAAAKNADAATNKFGLLHGVPIGLKDIIDTADLPTTYGSAAFKNHQPTAHAECVNVLREQGAIILGKTVTTEFAFFAPGPTVNPHNPGHTPGGSSSGSAAAVADFHVPITLGTQTAGSIIRPASFNGIFGYKPSYDTYSNHGVHPLAPSLDTLGCFTRSVDDLMLMNTVLGDAPPTKLIAEKPQRLAIVRTPYWSQATLDMRHAFDDFVQIAAANDIEIIDAAEKIDTLDEMIAEISDAQLSLMALEAKEILAPLVAKNGDLIRPETKNLMEMGLNAPPNTLEKIATARAHAEKIVAELFDISDVIFTPGALGAAPEGIEATGDPVFNRIWTFARLPCINLPLAKAAANLPLGAQLVGNFKQDQQLLAHAKFFEAISPYQIFPPH